MIRNVSAAAFLFLVSAMSAPLLAREATLTRAEIHDGWILLFDGESMFGLSQQGPLNWKVADGILIADGSGSGYIRTSSPFSDFDLKMEVLFSKAAGSGAIFVRTAKGNIPSENGYRIPFTDEDAAWPAGSVVYRWSANDTRPAAGQWHSFEIQAQGSHITVLLDQQKVADGNDSSAHAGYIALKVESGCRFEFRNIKLKPLPDSLLFDGSDLSGWKIAKPVPSKKPSKLKKIIPFAGGKPNIKESDWSVRIGTIHGEKGPGQLETTALYDDFVLQFEIPTVAKKQPGHAGLYIRGDAGDLFSGYEILMDPDRPGAIGPGLASPRKIIPINDIAAATVAASGRYFEVWVNGFPVTEFIDTRVEGLKTAQDAKTTAGVVALSLPDPAATSDYLKIQLTTEAKVFGGAVAKLPPPPAPLPTALQSSVTSAAAPAAPGMAPNPAIAMQQTAQQEAENRKRAAVLMGQALSTSDPSEQMRIYAQVIQIDPNNQAAFQGYNDAKAKVEAQQSEAQKQQQSKSEAEQNEAKKEDALNRAQQAFLAGDLTRASGLLAIAEQAVPNDSAVADLRRKINEAQAQSSRLRYLLGGGAVLGLGGLSAFWIVRRRRKEGFLQMVSGLDNGRRYNLNEQVVRIGAVAQDGPGKNDIVIRDIEHMVSRFHCEIHSQNGKFYVIDCGSSNGTRLDNRRVRSGEPARLKNGARLELGGSVVLRFGLERRKTGSS